MANALAGLTRNWLVLFLVGLLLGSVVTAAFAYSGFSGLVSEQDVRGLFNSLSNKVDEIEQKLDKNSIDVNGAFITAFNSLGKTVTDMKSEVDKIEHKLDVNGINESGYLLSFLNSWFKELNKSISSINATTIVKNFNTINNNINNIKKNILVINNNVKNINNNIKNIQNNLTLVFNSTKNIEYNILNVVEVQLTDIYTFITVDIYQSIQSLSIQITNIQNTLNEIYVSITQINFLVQKRVITETVPRSESTNPYHHEFFVQISVQGDGAVPESGITSVTIFNATGTYSVMETGLPGLYILSIERPSSTPTGQYVVVINTYAVITLPDGSTRMYNGTKIETIYVF